MDEKYLQDILEKEGNGKVFTYKSYSCEIIRHKNLGNLCGYVDLKPDSKYDGIEYDGIPVDVHGGLTFSSRKDNGCWRIGFDCAHFCDVTPYYNSILNYESTYRTMDYVENEVKRIIDQLEQKESKTNDTAKE